MSLIDAAVLKTLPAPTPEQQESFARHVCEAHSWYKHLPPEGAHFVVFLASDAGEGYPEDAPRLHYSWKTTAEYRRRFGHLDYLWRREAGWSRDAQDIPELSPELQSRCGFLLHPWCAGETETMETVNKEWFDRLRAGEPHPRGELLLRLLHTTREMNEVWEQLTEQETELALDEDARPEQLTPAVARLRQWEAVHGQAAAALVEEELERVRHALRALLKLRDPSQRPVEPARTLLR